MASRASAALLSPATLLVLLGAVAAPSRPRAPAAFVAVPLLGAAGTAGELPVLIADLDLRGPATAAGGRLGPTGGAARGPLRRILSAAEIALGAAGGLFVALLITGALVG